ncbi:hypothetical protein CXB35_11460 [Pseudomonas syringae]|nr:hypothetical protein CXB35_11460 [Pseudomonas syringae]
MVKQCTNEVLYIVRLRPIKTLSGKAVHNKFLIVQQLVAKTLTGRVIGQTLRKQRKNIRFFMIS